jgi:hypothetical protein
LFHEKNFFLQSSNKWEGKTINTKSILLTNCKSAEFATGQQRQGREAARLSVEKTKLRMSKNKNSRVSNGKEGSAIGCSKIKKYAKSPCRADFPEFRVPGCLSHRGLLVLKSTFLVHDCHYITPNTADSPEFLVPGGLVHGGLLVDEELLLRADHRARPHDPQEA